MLPIGFFLVILSCAVDILIELISSKFQDISTLHGARRDVNVKKELDPPPPRGNKLQLMTRGGHTP